MTIENAPVEEQQAPQSLETELSDAYDDLEASGADEEGVFEDNSIEESPDGEAEISEEGAEEEIAQGASEDEGHEEEGAEIEAGDYNEPAPERWPDEIKQAYNNATPEMKRVFMEQMYKPMQRQYTQTTQEIAQNRKALEPMLETLQQYAGDFEQAGINPVEAFNRQMAWSAHFAKVGAEQGAIDLAKAYGQAAGQPGGDNSDVYMTPVEKAQQARLDRLEGQLTQREQQELQRQEQARKAQQEARTNEVRSSITQFANEMRDGQPAHPHVEQVSTQMAGLIRGGLVHRTDEYGQPIPYIQQLGQAYQIACEMNPSIRQARDTRTRRQQVDKVTRASRDVVSKTPGQDVDVTDDRPLADSLSDLYDKLDRSAA